MEAPADENQRPASPVKVPRKRKRIVISCTECHRRKQKCDRASPCSNCVARNKQSLCRYENESARKQQLLEESTSPNYAGVPNYHSMKSRDPDPNLALSSFGYTKTNGHNNTTLGIFNKIQTYDKGNTSLTADPTGFSVDHGGLREKYKSYIRQLPAKEFIERLVVTYFREVNYQYYPLDEGIFRDLLNVWNSLPYSTFNKGPLELPGDLQYFPALLFQVLALALQYQPLDYDPSLDSLKYLGGMTLDDLAADYSESGYNIVHLLPKQQTTLVTVQAGFLRTNYLKHCGMIPESWHSLSQTIKDAQEIGLHKGSISFPRKIDGNPQDVLESLWLEQLRRRMWTILAVWDIHMAIVLGRPPTIDARDAKSVFPIDAPVPKNRREVAPTPRNPNTDPPTPLTMMLWNAEISSPLWDILNLEREDPNQNNFSKVETMHKNLKTIALHCPPQFRSQNPDTQWDSHPDCYWVPASRPIFQSGSAFTVMALHRPYIFTNASSRTEALKAALEILRAQRIHFNHLSAIHYKMFSLVLNTFDAIVLIAAIYILHPLENREYLDESVQQFEWAMERFQTMSTRNSMANGALGILKAIYIRLRKSIANQDRKIDPSLQSLPTSTPAEFKPSPSPNTPNAQFPTPHASISSASSTSNNQTTPSTNYTVPTIANLTEATPASSAEWEAFSSGSVTHTNPTYDFSNMPPLQPMHDLLYNNLDTVDGGLDLTSLPLQTPAGESVGTAWGTDAAGNWQFEGDFGNDSFWGFMNNYNPA